MVASASREKGKCQSSSQVISRVQVQIIGKAGLGSLHAAMHGAMRVHERMVGRSV